MLMASTIFPSKKNSMLLLLFFTVGIAALIPVGLSQLEPIPGPLAIIPVKISQLGPNLGPLPRISMPGPLPGQPGNGVCWSSITKIEGCFLEVMKAVNMGEIGEIGSACCRAILLIQDKCWPQMLPLHPFVAPLLKNFCIGAAPTPAPILV